MLTPNGGVFGRNPKFNNVTVENNLTVNGDFTLGDDIVINDTLLVNGQATFRGGIISIPNSAAPTSNTVLGSGAGAALQAGAIENVFVGMNSGQGTTTGDGNVSVGAFSTVQNTTSSSNTAVGTGAFYGGTGSQNVALGREALNGQTGNNATAVGFHAARINTASDITAVGANALDANTTGTGNTAVGKDALGANTTGTASTAVGVDALATVTTNSSSTALGYRAGRLATGTENTFIGAYAGATASSTGYSTIIGANANPVGAVTSSGNGQTIVGSFAGYNATGAANTLIGAGAGGAITTGARNTIICSVNPAAELGAGYTLTTGSGNVLIGRTDVTGSADTNEIVIAGGTGTTLGNGSNTTTIGNSSTTNTYIPAGNVILLGGASITIGTAGNGSNKGVFARNSTETQSVALVPAAGNDGQSFVGTVTNNPLQIRSNLTTRMTVGTDGNVSIANGNLVMSTAGTGIDFSATANGTGTMTSELLSDYEEGTWTPVYGTTGTGFTTMTMDPGTGTATYTKVGRQVTVRAWLQTDNVDATGATGNLVITGLPFTVNSSSWSAGAVGYCRNWAGNFPSNVFADAGTTRLYIESRATSNGTTALAVPADLTAGATADRNALMFACTYFV